MKTTTKLLLGVTLVAGLSISTFAACAADVYMGGKQLKNVADGTDDQDAVNYAQVMKSIDVNPVATISSDWDVTFSRAKQVGKSVCLQINIKNISGTSKAIGHHSIFTALNIKPLITMRVSGTDQKVPRQPIGGYISTAGQFGVYVTRAIDVNGTMDFASCYLRNN